MIPEFLISLSLTLSILAIITAIITARIQANELRKLRKEINNDRKQLQLMQVRVREIKTKFDRFIYVPKADRR